MATPRRRLIRPTAALHPEPDRRVPKLRSRLDAARRSLMRWQTRLRRAFNTVEKLQRSIRRLEQQLTRLEE